MYDVKKSYIYCRDTMIIDDEMDKDEWSNCVGIATIEKNGPYDAEYMMYGFIRNLLRSEINQMAKENGNDWQVVIQKRGKTVIKINNSRLANKEMTNRCRRISQHMMKAMKEFKLLDDNLELPPTDEVLLNGLRSNFLGLMMASGGAVKAMKDIDEDMRNMLLDIFDVNGII